jgi:hypothetical protein
MGRIKQYLSSNSALVPGPDGSSQVLESTLPLRPLDQNGVEQPVDLSLQSTGNVLRPVNPLAHVAIASRASDGVSFEDANFSVAPEADPAARAVVAHGKAFFANTGTDTDTLVAPLPGGAQFVSLLRSPQSPEAIRLRFNGLAPRRAITRSDERGPNPEHSTALPAMHR